MDAEVNAGEDFEDNFDVEHNENIDQAATDDHWDYYNPLGDDSNYDDDYANVIWEECRSEDEVA